MKNINRNFKAVLLVLAFFALGLNFSNAISNDRGSEKCVTQTECETTFECTGSGDLCELGTTVLITWYDN